MAVSQVGSTTTSYYVTNGANGASASSKTVTSSSTTVSSTTTRSGSVSTTSSATTVSSTTVVSSTQKEVEQHLQLAVQQRLAVLHLIRRQQLRQHVVRQ